MKHLRSQGANDNPPAARATSDCRPNARASNPAIPAILLFGARRPSLRLETQGLTAALCRMVAELVSAMSCYAQTRLDAVDLRDAAARLFDVANRMDPNPKLWGAVND